jgi:glycosyltransferase involved in cell wall biosynthesis
MIRKAGPDAARPRAGRPARILVVTPIYPTADRPEAGAFVARRVAALRERGLQVEVAAPPSYRVGGLRRHLTILRRALVPGSRPDGVEGHVLFVAGFIALLAARLQRRPLLIYAHGLDVRVTAQRTPVHRFLSRLVARGAGVVVTNSRATAEYVARLGVTAEVVPPGVDFARFEPGDRLAARVSVGLPAAARVALYVGTLSSRKGADVFAAALAASPGWLGVMVGSGEHEAQIRARQPQIHLAGVVEPNAVPTWMQAADVVVVPSREEPLGLAAIEALACGAPIIATRTGGLAEVVRDGVNGLLVEPGDAGAIRGALGRLEDPALRARLAAAARDSVAEHDIRRTTEAMATLWSRLGVSA